MLASRRLTVRFPFAAVLGACCVAATPGLFAAAANDLSTAARRLGASDFAERQRAGDLLFKAGASAIPLLRDAANSESPEVRLRASGILRRLELQLVDQQKGLILTGRLPYGVLTGWDRFQSIAGSTESSRRLFASMLEKAPDLILSIGMTDMAESFDRRVYDLNATFWQRSRGSDLQSEDSPEELAALLFASLQPECVPTPAQAQALASAAERGWFAMQVSGGAHREPLTAIMQAWVTRKGVPGADARLRVAQHFSYRAEGLVAAREVLAERTGAANLQSALLYISQFGSMDDIPRVEALLANDDEIHAFQGNSQSNSLQTHVRDLALVALCRMTKQNPVDFGMKEYKEQSGVPRVASIGFADKDDREVAILRWNAWRLAHVKANLKLDGRAVEGRSG